MQTATTEPWIKRCRPDSRSGAGRESGPRGIVIEMETSPMQNRGTSIPGGGVEPRESESLSFILPSFPISFNRLYDINHLTRSVTLSDQAALWKTRTIPFVKPCRWPDTWLLRLVLVYESPAWLTKKGTLRRVDVQNLEKLVIDTMFAKWGADDSRLVEITSSKTYGPREQIKVTLERVERELGR